MFAWWSGGIAACFTARCLEENGGSAFNTGNTTCSTGVMRDYHYFVNSTFHPRTLETLTITTCWNQIETSNLNGCGLKVEKYAALGMGASRSSHANGEVKGFWSSKIRPFSIETYGDLGIPHRKFDPHLLKVLKGSHEKCLGRSHTVAIPGGAIRAIDELNHVSNVHMFEPYRTTSTYIANPIYLSNQWCVFIQQCFFMFKTIAGWWFGCHQFGIFPLRLGFRLSSQLTHIFQDGVALAQPTRLFLFSQCASSPNIYPLGVPPHFPGALTGSGGSGCDSPVVDAQKSDWDVLGYTGIYWDTLGYIGIHWDILGCHPDFCEKLWVKRYGEMSM